MKQTINEHQFINAFDKDENFSYEALELLFKYFEQYEEDTGEEIELDPIAIRCEYVEMSKEELLDQYPIETRFPSLKDYINEQNSEEEKEDIVQRYLENSGLLIGKTASGFVFLQH
tara:strand:+ start:626 stop:973 length:348 start_codon:yes stop_codon:yes gene_type:complete